MSQPSENLDILDNFTIINDDIQEEKNTLFDEDIIKKINLKQKISLKILGKINLGRYKRHGWKSTLPFYLFKCPKHGLQISYPMGWKKLLICSECIK